MVGHESRQGTQVCATRVRNELAVACWAHAYPAHDCDQFLGQVVVPHSPDYVARSCAPSGCDLCARVRIDRRRVGTRKNRSPGLIVLQLEGGGMERSEVVGRHGRRPKAPIPHCRQPSHGALFQKVAALRVRTEADFPDEWRETRENLRRVQGLQGGET